MRRNLSLAYVIPLSFIGSIIFSYSWVDYFDVVKVKITFNQYPLKNNQQCENMKIWNA
jgi:hypothetical protein